MNFVYDMFSSTVIRVGFEDVLLCMNNNNCILINTLAIEQQSCLIDKTISAEKEEEILNRFLETYESRTVKVIVYGKNSADSSVEEKSRQLKNLGFKNVFIYGGGLFEWILLQDIYGTEMFKTTKKVADILAFKAPCFLNLNNHIPKY